MTERIYPYLAYNLRRQDMAPISVPNADYDACLDDEWTNPYGVVRGGSVPKKVGRPRKEQK